MTLHYAFVDESGSEKPFSKEPFLIIALLCTTQPRDLALCVQRARKKYGSSLQSGEMKASRSRRQVINDLLQAIAGTSVEAIIVVVDKQCILRPPADPDAIYRKAIATTVRQAVARWARLALCLDKHYTSSRMRDRLNQEIQSVVTGLSADLVRIDHDDSIARPELQAADAVAWAVFQKYNLGVAEHYDIIAKRIVVEEVIAQAFW